jgi:WD40 repeat protein
MSEPGSDTYREGRDVRSFLKQAGELEPAKVADLLCADQAERWRRGERVPAEAYLRLHPAVEADSPEAFELVFSELVLREHLGEAPALAEYQWRFPHFAERLERQLSVHRALAGEAVDEEGLVEERTWRGTGASPTPAPAPAPPGYEILSELGRGGMGVVYKARHLALNRIVALKVLRDGALTEADDRRFRREAEVVARLAHPNIVSIYEVGEWGRQPYLALEYVEGSSLREWLGGSPQAPRPAAELVEVLARAIHHAHQQGVVHRDLSPGNVLLARPDVAASLQLADSAQAPIGKLQTCRHVPKITDFGLAKHLTDADRQTRTGDVLGTPSYMAPEQAQGRAHDVSPATDVYALGAILYELLTGRPPFKAPTVMGTLLQVVSAEPVPPARLQPTVPRDLETVCLKCLAKEPARRYASALALADDLRRFLAGEPVRARPVGPLGRAAKWARRRPAVAALLAALVLVSAAGAALVSWKWAEAVRQKGLAEESAEAEARARHGAEQDRDRADKLREEAEQREARLALERGHELCRRGSLSKGLLWLARSLELAERTGNGPLARAVRINLGDWRRQLTEVALVMPLPGPFHTATFDNTGKKVLVAANLVAREYDAQSGRPVGPAMVTVSLAHGGDNLRQVRCVAYSRDGKVALVARSNGGALLWDVVKRRNVRRLAHGTKDIWAVDFSADDKTLLTAGTDEKGHSVRFWDRATGRPVGKPLRHSADQRIWGAAFSPNDHLVVTAGADRVARFWDWRTGGPRDAALPHQDEVTIVQFSPDGKAVLTGCRDGTVQLWDVMTRKPIGPPVFHLGDITALAFRPDGRAFLTGSRDRSARLWHMATRQPLATFQHEGTVSAVALSPDGKTCLTGSEHELRLWRLPEELSLGPPLAHNQPVFSVALSADDGVLLTGSKDRARLWSVARGKLLAHWGGDAPSSNTVRAVALAPDGRTVAIGSWHHGAHLFRFVGPGELSRLGPPIDRPFKYEDSVPLLALGKSARHLFMKQESAGQRVEMWEWKDGAIERQRTFAHPANVALLAVGPGGDLLTGCENRTVYVWDTATGKRVALAQPDAVHAVAQARDGHTLLVGCADGAARLWDVRTGRLRGALHHQGDVLAVAFSPDGKTALTGSADQMVRLWDVATAAPLGPPRWHAGAVQAVAFSHRGDRIVSGSHDRTAQFWRGTTEPLQGRWQAIKAWAEVLAGVELASGAERALGEGELAQRRKVAGGSLR